MSLFIAIVRVCGSELRTPSMPTLALITVYVAFCITPIQLRESDLLSGKQGLLCTYSNGATLEHRFTPSDSVQSCMRSNLLRFTRAQTLLPAWCLMASLAPI